MRVCVCAVAAHAEADRQAELKGQEGRMQEELRKDFDAQRTQWVRREKQLEALVWRFPFSAAPFCVFELSFSVVFFVVL